MLGGGAEWVDFVCVGYFVCTLLMRVFFLAADGRRRDAYENRWRSLEMREENTHNLYVNASVRTFYYGLFVQLLCELLRCKKDIFVSLYIWRHTNNRRRRYKYAAFDQNCVVRRPKTNEQEEYANRVVCLYCLRRETGLGPILVNGNRSSGLHVFAFAALPRLVWVLRLRFTSRTIHCILGKS